ncbi:hypothetical protein NQ318_006415 [Aromia moschata]|uniref:Uncharacterized protein n=1 Tax=Aromia moschata TaxID=1265417 RepID=A0AAV8X7Q6_9CUCU|nr:hypothetical protein NQ318_006415 [Aromia moschata]
MVNTLYLVSILAKSSFILMRSSLSILSISPILRRKDNDIIKEGLIRIIVLSSDPDFDLIGSHLVAYSMANDEEWCFDVTNGIEMKQSQTHT